MMSFVNTRVVLVLKNMNNYGEIKNKCINELHIYFYEESKSTVIELRDCAVYNFFIHTVGGLRSNPTPIKLPSEISFFGFYNPPGVDVHFDIFPEYTEKETEKGISYFLREGLTKKENLTYIKKIRLGVK